MERDLAESRSLAGTIKQWIGKQALAATSLVHSFGTTSLEHRIHPVGLARFIWYSNNRINPVLRPVKTGVPRRNPKKYPKKKLKE
ncbi:MAG: hypothetical protein M0P99_02280, partial [Candidatus Cloacimonetes bacterium]|nr:hypothetical protein [Candidatus Cloacimonadota bacterium]